MRTVGVKLAADVSDYTSKIRGAGRTTDDFLGNLDKAARKGNLDAVADRAGVAGLALVGMAGYAVKAAADFDKSMSAVSAATHASTGDLDKLRQAALQAGKDTAFSATEAADGITELSKAGVSTADVLNGGLKGALSLAAAGQISVAEAAETAASAMTQFKLKGDKIPHVADLLAAGAGKAQGSVHDMGAALNQSGLVAAQFGLSIEDTTGALAEFASAGLLGSDAGTSLKTMLLAIANPSKQTKDLMDELGISFYDAQGKFIGLAGVAQVLQTRMKDLTDAQRQQALGQIFGSDAIRAASILYTDGAAGAEKWKNAVNDSGFAAETAAKLTDNLAGDIEKLKGSIETLAIQSGTGANGGLRILVQTINNLVNNFLDLPGVVTSTATVLTGVTGVALVLGAGWVKLRRSTESVRLELEALGPAGVRAGSALQTTSKWAGRAGAAFIGLQAAGAVVSSFMTDLSPRTEAAAQGLADWNRQAGLAGEAARLFGKDGDVLTRSLSALGNDGFSHATDATTDFLFGLIGLSSPLDDAKDRTKAFDDALAALVAKGDARKAAAAVEEMANRAGISVTRAKELLPGYAAALDNAGTAASGAASKTGDLTSALKLGADAQDKYTTEAEAAAGAARGEAEAVTALTDKLRAQVDPVFGLLEAERSLTEAQKAATKAVKEHGRNSDEAREATRKLALAAIDLQAKAGAAGATVSGRMTPALYDTLRAAGLTEAQIKDVAKQFRDAKRDGERFSKTYTQTIKTRYVTTQENFVGPVLPGSPYSKRAAGGPVVKGVPYIVGERRPEVFVPDQDGRIVPSVSQFTGALRGDASAARVMPSARASTSLTVVEHRVTFDGAQGELGQLFLKAIRTSPGVKATAAKLLGVTG